MNSYDAINDLFDKIMELSLTVYPIIFVLFLLLFFMKQFVKFLTGENNESDKNPENEDIMLTIKKDETIDKEKTKQ